MQIVIGMRCASDNRHPRVEEWKPRREAKWLRPKRQSFHVILTKLRILFIDSPLLKFIRKSWPKMMVKEEVKKRP